MEQRNSSIEKREKTLGYLIPAPYGRIVSRRGLISLIRAAVQGLHGEAVKDKILPEWKEVDASAAGLLVSPPPRGP